MHFPHIASWASACAGPPACSHQKRQVRRSCRSWESESATSRCARHASAPFCKRLHQQLQGLGISTIVFAGVQTSGCVLSGVRAAHDLDYRVIVLSDGCADPDASVHAFLMNTIFPKQATVMTINEYEKTLAAARGAARP